ncbi:MAG: penicillin-binding protein activator [Alphaproteobacteria bacterium]|nr:penicillin-binding protein activator [Alphaproteobacteria bacterium]
MAAIGLALTVAACGGVAVQSPRAPATSSTASRPPPPTTGPMRVAVLAPLTGDYAPIGQQLVNAAAIALFEGQQAAFELVPMDTGGTVSGAAAAAANAQQQRVDMVIGPLFSQNVPPVRNALAASNTAILTFTNDTAMAGGNVFVMGVSVDSQVEALAQSLGQTGKRRLLIFGPDNEYTHRTINAVQRLAVLGQVTLVRSAVFDPNADFNTISQQVKQVTDYDRRRGDWRAYESRLVPQVRRSDNPAALLRSEASRFPDGSIRQRMLLGMASVYNQHISRGRNQAISEVVGRIEGVDAMPADDFDAVLLPFGDNNLVAVGSMLDLYNAGLPFAQLVGTNVWEQDALAREPSFHNAWYTAMDRQALEPFLLSYRSHYQEDPDPIAVLGYYAARVAATAASNGVRPVDGRFVQSPQGFTGLGGTVRFGTDNRMQAPLTIYQITPEGAKPLTGPATLPAS